MYPSSIATFFCCALVLVETKSFSLKSAVRRTVPSTSSTGTALSSAPVTAAEAVSASKLTWQSLEEELSSANPHQDIREPVLTLYRDTNGWCPFCERVWVAIRAKNLPYEERLISLFDKPEWYKDLVPTTQVPAVLFHNPISDEEPHARKLVWESLDILKALDDEFPSSPRLVLDTPEYKAASEQNTKLGSAGVGFVYASDLTEEEQAEKKKGFLKALDDLEDALIASGGPFRLGKEFTALDAEMVPTLERWRWQMPLSKGFNILEGRPAIQKWFDAMDEFTPYSDRVAGDEYSWVCTVAMFARYFGDIDNPKTQTIIDRSEAAAEKLVETFKDSDDICEAKFAFEAAQKIISNNEAIVADCTNLDPKSQKHMARSESKETADKVLQYVTSLLLKGDGAIEHARTSQLVEIADDHKPDASLSAMTIASRLCVPRDMSAPAAKVLRSVLTIVADRWNISSK